MSDFVNSDIIAFIDVSYDELSLMPIKNLEEKIAQNIKSYLDGIPQMNNKEKIDMRELVKETRKMRFRFSQKTENISKERIQIALTYLAKLFRVLNDDIKELSEKTNQDK